MSSGIGSQLVRGMAGLTFAFLAVVSALAQTPSTLPQPIAPTVTAAMGDPGGKLFGRAPDPQKTRRYYIAAESEMWEYAPSGRDDICGAPLPPPVLLEPRVGKLRYVQYTDATFGTKVIANPGLGILGPVLRGVVGEYLVVTFLNRTDQPLSMHPHGVRYDKDNEGSYYRPGPGRGAAIGPGAKFTYVWQLDEASGPAAGEPSSKGWLYHSHVDGDAEANLGLVGGIIVTDPKRARPDGTPSDVDREFAALFMIFDESGLDNAAIEAVEYAGLGLGTGVPPPNWAQVQQQLEQGSRFSINGRIFGNLPPFQMNEGERTRWYLFGLGSEEDFHTAHWHGLRVVEEGRRRTDVVELLPASMKVADMVADVPGSWLFHCHVAEHMREGMFAGVVVHPRDAVGVDRAPERAFLGLPAAARSLRVDEAVTAAGGTELRLEGAMTVFEAFSVFSQPVTVRFADKTSVFRPGPSGKARTTEGTFRAKNTNEFGVVAGGMMEFEITLRGLDGALARQASSAGLPLSIEVGRARHEANIRIKASPAGR